jgi:dTDP-4-dehydrorhamnose reductase
MLKKYDVIIIGAKGFLGEEFANFFKDKNYKILKVNSKNYNSLKGARSKILINANGNSYRFKANQNPQWDFKKTFLSVRKSIQDFKHDMYIYISTIDVYNFKNNKKKTNEKSYIDPSKLDFYAFHKWLSEKYVERNTKSYLIFRTGTLIGQKMRKGPLFDIIKTKSIFMSLESKLSLISVSSAVNIIYKIIKLKKKNQVFNLTGSGGFMLGNLKKKFRDIKILNNSIHNYEININKIKKYVRVPSSIFEINNFLKKSKF